MPNVLYGNIINAELEAREPWPQIITLYQPYEVEQILLPDNANCLAVQAFLKMCGVDFQIEARSNAEYMSPSGQVPFIQFGEILVSEFDNIVSFMGTKGRSLSNHLSTTEKVDMRAYMSLVNNVFVNAELYICWVDETIFKSVTKIRHGSVYPWPLNHLLNYQKRKEIVKKLSVLGWYNKSIDEICNDVDSCCFALSQKLEDRKYFYGNDPTEIDALVYGHLHALFNFVMPGAVQQVNATVRRFSRLVNHESIMNHYSNCILVQYSEDFEVSQTISKDTLWNYPESIESLPPLSESLFQL